MEREKMVRLVSAAQNGDPQAMNQLFNAFYNDVYYIALKTVKDQDDACDVTQETFVEVINTIGSLREPAAFVTWINQIAFHQCTRFFKKKKDVLVSEDEDGLTIFDSLEEDREEFIPDKSMDQQDFRKTILDMLDTLSEEQRSATLLYYYKEMSVKQIAQIQSVSEGTVKSRLNYARKAIKSSVEAYEKKNNIKLHSFGMFPLFAWLLLQEEMSAAAATAVAGGISAETGTAIAVQGASAGTAAAAAGTAAGAAAVPLGVKIAAIVAAAAAVISGAIAAITSANREDPGAVTQPPCVHIWAEASCQAPKTCTVCGIAEGEALPHTWQDATCEAPKTCAACGIAEGEALPHTWQDATCETAKTCSVCGEIEGTALGHTWVDADYQTPMTCCVCAAVEGEPLTPGYVKDGITINVTEIGTEYDYITTCEFDLTKKTVGKMHIESYSVFESDETHDAAEGYEWRVVTVKISFSDKNASKYSIGVVYFVGDYYENGPWGIISEGDVNKYSVDYSSTSYAECINYNTAEWSEWNKGTIWLTHTFHFRVPVGYDGCVIGYFDSATPVGEGSYARDVVDENSLIFRLK